MLRIKSKLKSILRSTLRSTLRSILRSILNKIRHNTAVYRNNRYAKRIFSKKRLDNPRRGILNYYSTFPQDKMPVELSAAVDFLKHNPVTYFPRNLTETCRAEMVHSDFDHETGLYFALINGKRMFFKRGWSESECIHYCYCIQNEQNANSPHRYLSESFTVQTGDIAIDVGAAEGIFALEVIEKVSKIYLFESDSGWTEALKATFAPWRDKVEIVNKYLSDEENPSSTTVDNFFQNRKKPAFIKIDVDGAEAKVINGCRQLLSSQEHLKLALCTYHKQDDESSFSALLREKGFDISFSPGFMLFINDELRPPYFRRGVLQAMR